MVGHYLQLYEKAGGSPPGRAMRPHGDRGRAVGLVGWLQLGRATLTPSFGFGVPLRHPGAAACAVLLARLALIT